MKENETKVKRLGDTISELRLRSLQDLGGQKVKYLITNTQRENLDVA